MRYVVILISLVLFSCGTRKAATTKVLQAVELKSSTDIKTDSEIQVKNEVEDKVEQQNDIQKKNTFTTVEEEFDPKTGNLTKRKTSTGTKSKSDNSKISGSKTVKSDSSAKVKIEAKVKVDSTGKSLNKTKQVEADKTVVNNFGGRIVLIILFSILIAGILIYVLIKTFIINKIKP